ncbi:citrate (Si)-synthase [gut metagenome]|uniref:Citrate (Si)-synthase n=1 Tax=gut metagenome TaxID=749906 RepID=J9GMT8_9ZZZZ
MRDINGKGVLAGLTQVSNVKAVKTVDGKEVPCAGSLSYRGYDIKELTAGFVKDNRFGFEETTYLLLFGELPDRQQLADFTKLLANQRCLPTNFVRDVVMKAPCHDIMNALARSVLTLYSYDSDPDDISLPNVLRQCLNLISVFPLLSVYGYQAYNHYIRGKSLYIHNPKNELSTAENILRMLRPDKKYTDLEAKILDQALILHMEHGGGNNSTFTTHVVSSSGTDTYSTVAAALGSLKGPKHGGANIKVVSMFQDLKNHVKDWTDEDEVRDYLRKLLHKEAFDRRGLIYGMGHAIYSVSDPRAEVLKGFVESLAKEKGRMKDYNLYAMIERLAPEVIAEERKIYKGVSANVDFYSGFVYSMLDLPLELYTPMFAVARIVGWSAHRMEELINTDKIIRPAYKNVLEPLAYIPLSER